MNSTTTPTAPNTRAEVRAVPVQAGRRRLHKPLILRIGDIHGLTPLRIFVVVALLTGLVSWWLQTPIATGINTAYALAMINYLVRRDQRLLLQLRPLIAMDDAQFKYEWYALTHFRRALITGFGLLAPAALVVVNWNSIALHDLLHGIAWPLTYLWSFALAMIDWVLIMQLLVIILSNSWRFYLLGRYKTIINLLDTSTLAPYALAGLTVLVFFAGGYTVIPIAAFDRDHLLGAALRALLVCLPITILGTALPVLGIYRNLRDAKAAEIARVTRAIHGDRGALAGSHLAAESDTVPVSNLVLYRQTISAISEWPVESVGAVRVALIIIVPILAWVGGALVDRLMDRMLG